MAQAGCRVVVVMGVSGVGKSTVGPLLADRLAVPYTEGDDFHPPENIARMSIGVPLDDPERLTWLDMIGEWVRGHEGRGGVISCSALRRRYRDRLRAMAPGLFFLYLEGDRDLLARRLGGREGHFMPAALLGSQLTALEPLSEEEDGMAVNVAASPGAIVERVAAVLGTCP